MKKFIMIISLFFALNANAQQVRKEGNTFVQVSTPKKQGEEKKTNYTYKDSKGNMYPIYLSPSGKAFIKRTSNKTGKEYKQYLPDVGRQINPQAYK